jgi:hypothetical protein
MQQMIVGYGCNYQISYNPTTQQSTIKLFGSSSSAGIGKLLGTYILDGEVKEFKADFKITLPDGVTVTLVVFYLDDPSRSFHRFRGLGIKTVRGVGMSTTFGGVFYTWDIPY